MFLLKSVQLLKQHLRQKSIEGYKIGFVPTMGALHQGHLNLIAASMQKGLYTVCSIFVNPTQFNNKDDFDKYPNTLEADLEKLNEMGCHVLFHPDAEGMYGQDVIAEAHDYGSITQNYEGAMRPGHFNGVITIVTKLFDAVEPDEVFFGQKDLQQCMVIKELIRRLFPNIQMHIVPTQREESGLAMSSRNLRLSIEERVVAVNFSKALFAVEQSLRLGKEVKMALEEATATWLIHPLIKLEYFDVIDAEWMTPVDSISNPSRTYAAVIAGWCGQIRLIDNVMLTE